MEESAGYVVTLLVGGAIGWWARYAFTKTAIAISVLRQMANDLNNKANFFDDVALAEAPDAKHIVQWRGDAHTLTQAAKLLEGSGDTQDAGDGAIT